MKTWTPMLQNREHGYPSYFYVVIFVGYFVLPLYAINLGAAKLFADSLFQFLAILNFNDLYFQFE
jgi:hypothetical protein